MVEIRRLEEMMTVMTERSHRDAAVVYILRGELARFQRNNGKYERLDTVRRGGCVRSCFLNIILFKGVVTYVLLLYAVLLLGAWAS